MDIECEITTKAINILETEGWTQGDYYKEGEGYCILGALYKAAGWDFATDGRTPPTETISLMNIVVSKMKFMYWPSHFNDQPSTTKEEVIIKLKEAC